MSVPTTLPASVPLHDGADDDVRALHARDGFTVLARALQPDDVAGPGR